MSEQPTNVEVCTIVDVGIEVTGSDAPPLIEAINEYLSIFAKPVKRDGSASWLMGSSECLNCSAQLDGALGSFQWGIVHGEGHCTGCGWPCRAYHRLKDSDGEIFDGVLERILQYHPSGVSKKGG